MEEIISLRRENSKTYDLGNGRRRLEVSIGIIHYKDDYSNPAEAWKDIDLSWEGNRITKAPYELTVAGEKFTLKDKKTGEISTIERTSVFPPEIALEIIPELSAVRFRHTVPSDKLPFEAKFKVTGNPSITRAFDDEGELELETSFVDGVLTEKLLQIKDRETGQVRPTKGSIRVDPTWQVGASSDDCYRQLTASAWSLTYSGFLAGATSTTSYQVGGGARFTNITIPQGTIINQAYLTLRAQFSYSGTVVNTRISAEDVNDAPTFANDVVAFDARWAARTTARVNWDAIPAWTQDVDYNSPEIKTVIQEIVDRAGWASGNDMVIFWEDFENRSTHAAGVHRRGYSWDGSTTYAPKLVIEYTVAAVGKSSWEFRKSHRRLGRTAFYPDLTMG